jgi:hypothetical protein
MELCHWYSVPSFSAVTSRLNEEKTNQWIVYVKHSGAGELAMLNVEPDMMRVIPRPNRLPVFKKCRQEIYISPKISQS